VANENFTLYEHPDAGTVRTVNPGARFSETPARMWRTPPRLGENTEEVLRELGVEDLASTPGEEADGICLVSIPSFGHAHVLRLKY